MKILLLAQSFPPPSAAGSAQYIANIFSAMPPGSTVVMTGNAEPEEAKKFDKSFPQVVRRYSFILHVAYGYKAGKFARLREYILWPVFAAWAILREKPDVVMIGEFNVSTITALLARRIFGISFLLFTYAEEITYITSRPLYLRLLKAVLRNADAVVTVSEYTKRLLEQLGARPERIHKILPAVSAEKTATNPQLQAALREKYFLNGCRILLTAGRLVERKGHVSVVEALPSILQELPSTRYVIVGAGPEEQKIRAAVKNYGLEDKVIFAGRVEDNELACWYELCEVFVMPHRSLAGSGDTEGCPTVFLEAGFHGKPVVGGQDGGVSDAIVHEHTGYIIDGTNTIKLAETICYLLKNQELAVKMGAEGRAYAETLDPGSRAQSLWNLVLQIQSNSLG